MSDCVRVKAWATLDPYELSGIDRYTLLNGIREAADEIERLTRDRDALAAELLRVLHDAKFLYRLARRWETTPCISYLEEPKVHP